MMVGSKQHCVKSVRIRSFSGPYFPAFGMNVERYSVSLRIQSECGKMRTRKAPNTDTFHAVQIEKMLTAINFLANQIPSHTSLQWYSGAINMKVYK